MDTDAGPIHCRDVLVATNGYTDSLLRTVQRRIVTLRSGLIATAALPPEVMTRLMPKGRVYGNTNRVFYYFRAAPGRCSSQIGTFSCCAGVTNGVGAASTIFTKSGDCGPIPSTWPQSAAFTQCVGPRAFLYL